MEKAKLLILRITERCNLECRYCYAKCGYTGDMSLDTAKKAIDRFTVPGDRLKIQFTGGEPLLCPDMLRSVALYTKKRGVSAAFSIQTNGTLLNDANCELLKRMDCAVGVSLDGMGEANELRIYGDGVPAFNDVINGIRTLAAHTMQCNINAVVTRVNQAELYRLIDLAAYLGCVRGVGLDMFRPIGRGRENDFSPSCESLARDIRRMLERAKELRSLGVDVRIKEEEKVKSMIHRGYSGGCYCYAQTGESVAVDFRGDVYPCSSFAGMNEYRMGNIEYEIESVPKHICEPHKNCAQCGRLPICRGGCPAGRAALCGINEADCVMHTTFIDYEREQHD